MIDENTSQPQNKNKSTLVLILSYIEIDANLPYDIDNKICINRANIQQINIFKKEHAKFDFPPDPTYPYEYDLTQDNGNKISDINSWKYWIIQIKGNGNGLIYLESALSLYYPKIKIGSWLCTDNNFETYRSARMPFSYYANYWDEEISFNPILIKLAIKDLDFIKTVYLKLKDIALNHDNTSLSVVREFNNLDYIHKGSNIKTLGYFAIIESLLVHKPAPQDPTSSITRQVISKINFINNRLIEKEIESLNEIDFYSYFGDTKYDTVMKKAYDYRSCIAHGNKIDFQKEFACLKSQKNVDLFLKEMTRKILLYYIFKLNIVSDLKQC
jgi:Apea-like HEPN